MKYESLLFADSDTDTYCFLLLDSKSHHTIRKFTNIKTIVLDILSLCLKNSKP